MSFSLLSTKISFEISSFNMPVNDVTRTDFKSKVRVVQPLHIYAHFQPQHALPDVFLWLISGGKRQAYQRIPARDIIYSVVEEERGKDCGKVRTMFLKVSFFLFTMKR